MSASNQNMPLIESYEAEAKSLTKKYYKNEIFVRALIEFSSYCRRKCFYCGLRSENKTAIRYRLTKSEILVLVNNAYQDGIRSIVLQSGEDVSFSSECLENIIKTIHDSYPDIAITLSIGQRDIKTNITLRNAGAERFLIKHESCNSTIYNRLHPDQNLSERLKAMERILKAGFILGSGFIVGLPSQTNNDILHEMYNLRKNKYDMFGIGVFMPTKNTPLENYPRGSIGLTYKSIILSRCFLPETLIPITTAFHSSSGKDMTIKAITNVANVFMVSYTTSRVKNSYQIYDNKKSLTLDESCKLIEKAGKLPTFTRGDPYHVNH
ncbi:MAG: [FeFe] hydrogenase H-cluster radical SAM maturase HydE [Caldisericia bacterium]|nr:[FeFe] hydrogenase H-cluster radical SAM maturase HydE [Caldisericia bacterium]